MSTMYVRPSMVMAGDDCRRKMYYQYIAGIRPVAKPVNLLFGTSVDVAVKTYLENLVAGQPSDPVKVFEDHYTNSTRNLTVSYSREQSPEMMVDMGKALMRQLPEAWDDTGFVPVVSPDGKPVLSRRLNATITPGVVLTGELDLLVYTRNGEIAIADLKTGSQESEFAFIRNSDQLVPYDILTATNNQDLGIEHVEAVGIWEFLKRKVPTGKSRSQGPQILPPKIVERPTENQRAEYRQKVLWMVEDIQRGRFPKSSRLPHNTPCKLCDYAKFCSEGCTDDLVFPQGTEQQLSIAA